MYYFFSMQNKIRITNMITFFSIIAFMYINFSAIGFVSDYDLSILSSDGIQIKMLSRFRTERQ